MKRIICLLLCLVMLAGCASVPAETTGPVMETEPARVISEEATVVYPQTGDYQETALMANVPDQGTPLLLSVRSDGSVDYIYTELHERGELGNFVEGRVHHYVIGPNGTAIRQDDGWMAELDAYTAEVSEAAGLENGRWRYLFAAEEGVILILAQFHDIVTTVDTSGNYQNNGEFRHSALFKLSGGVLSKLPMEWAAETGHGVTTQLDREYITDISMTGGEIELVLDASPYVADRNWRIRYAQDGTISQVEILPTDGGFFGFYVKVDADGMILYTEVQPQEAPPPYLIYRDISHYELPTVQEQTYTEDDSLYALGRELGNLEMTAYGEDGTFYCWFRELGNGVLMRYTPNPSGKMEPEIVTVWSLEPIAIIETAVAKWNQTHASPIFRYETGEAQMSGTELTQEDILTRLRLELANGQGPDVLVLDGWYTDGILDFMAPLDALDLSGVYESLVERFTVGGETLALPVRLEPYLLARSPEGTQEIGSLTEFADIITATSQLDMGGHGGGYRYFDAMYNIYDAAQLFQLWYPAWADAIWEDGRYHAEGFREFLTQLGRLAEHYQLDEPNWYEYGEEAESILNATDGHMYGNENRYCFPYLLAATDHVGLYAYWWYDDDVGMKPDPNPCYLTGIPGPDGSGAAVARVITAVRAGGAESAGMEFLQLLLTEEMQLGAGAYDPTCADGYPVKWSSTEHLLERMEDYMNQEFALQNDYREVLTGLRAVVLDEMLYDAALEAAMSHLRGEPTDFEQSKGLSWEVLSVDEAAEWLEEATRLYLAEQR